MSTVKIGLGGETPVVLSGPIGVTRPIVGPTLAGQPPGINEIRWESPDGRAYELEAMIQVIDLAGMTPSGIYQNIKWQLFSVAHGSVAYDFPHPMAQQNLCSWAMPSRGVRVRFAARAAILRVSNANAGNAAPVVKWSLQPVLGGDFTPYPMLDYRQATGAAIANPPSFPMGANEFRFTSLFNDPLIEIQFLSFTQGLLYTRPMAVLTDWNVIPIDASYWWPAIGGAATDLQVCAVYR